MKHVPPKHTVISATCRISETLLRPAPHIRYHIAAILAAHWIEFLAQYKRWIRPARHGVLEYWIVGVLGKRNAQGSIVPTFHSPCLFDPKTLDLDTEVMRF